MAVTLGQQYHVGEKPTVVILHTYRYIVYRHAGTLDKNKDKKTR